MLSSKCAICGSKTSRFIEKQELIGMISSLGLTTPLLKISLLGDILFWVQLHWMEIHWRF